MEKTWRNAIRFLFYYIIICIFTCFLIGETKTSIFYFTSNLISSIIAIFNYFVSKIYLDIQRKYTYKDLGLVIGSIGSINLVYIVYELSHMQTNELFKNNTLVIQLLVVLSGALLYSIFIHNFRNRKFLKNIIYVFNLTMVSLLCLIISFNLGNILVNNKYFIIISLIIPMISILLHINNFTSLHILRKYLRKETIRDLKIIAILQILRGISQLIYINLDFALVSITLYYINILINLGTSLVILMISTRDIIKKPNQLLYNKYHIEKAKLHKYIVELENKNEEVTNYKNWIYDSMMSIPEGMIICENRKIVFANNKIKSYLEDSNGNCLEGSDYEDIVVSRNKSDEVNGLAINNIKLRFEGNEFIGQELNLESKDKFGSLNMIILKDINLEQKLEELIHKLEHKNRIDLSRNELLSNLSHEFKTPVNIIYSTAQLQELNFKKGDIEKEIEYINLIKRNCNRLIRLINNFIDSTKFESNIVNTDLKLVNIVSLVEDLTESVINFAKNKNINITFDTEKEEIYTLVDIEFVERIVLNVLSNAIKYNKENGEILVSIEDVNNNVHIRIKDTGIGIPKNKLEKLFDRFERFDNNTLSHEEGTGIGLNIVKQMVDALAGKIKAESEVDKGTTITITLPISKNLNLHKHNNYGDLNRRAELELSDI